MIAEMVLLWARGWNLILEEMEHAINRGAQIIGEIKGYGMSSDSFHYTLPEPTGDGAYRAMKNSLIDAELSASEINYINAHGTSTPSGDQIEAVAIDRLFDIVIRKLMFHRQSHKLVIYLVRLVQLKLFILY